jgi:PAS domain S-box-containing protein
MNKILIVDDQKQNLYLLKTLLGGHGYQVLEATNGAEGLELARANPPDIIISDILMPVMDGFSLCKEWKKDEGLRNIPFIFYTATYTDPKDEEFALSLGATRFIVKPVEIEEFISILEQVITEVEFGLLAAPQKTLHEETTYYRMYNETLIRKLEDKMLELEKVNRALEEDISQRKQAEENLRASEQKFSVFFEKASFTAALARLPDGTMVDVNEAFERAFGYTKQEAIGRNSLELGINPDAEGRERVLAGLTEQGSAHGLELVLHTKFGASRIHTVNVDLVDIGAEKFILSTTQDITERKQAEEKIQQQLKRLNGLRMIDIAISSSFDLHVVLDVVLQQVVSQLDVDAGAILLFNPQLQTIEYAANRGFRSNVIQHAKLTLGEGYAGRAMLERRTVRVLNLMGTSGELARATQFVNENFVDYYGTPLISKGEVKGVLEIYHRAPLDLDPERLDFMETLAGQAAIAIDNVQLYDSLQRSNFELSAAYDATIAGWSRAMDLRDKETEGHTHRVTELAVRLAREMGIVEAELVHVHRGGLLHDMGKLGVPDNILLKPGELTNEEWEVMRKHPQFAYDMLSGIRYIKPALEIPYCHHEKWDGTGYPRGLRGEQIPLTARIFAVVDVWDAITSDRLYRSAWTRDEALGYIKDQSGKYFDPQVVEAFLKMIVKQ